VRPLRVGENRPHGSLDPRAVGPRSGSSSHLGRIADEPPRASIRYSAKPQSRTIPGDMSVIRAEHRSTAQNLPKNCRINASSASKILLSRERSKTLSRPRGNPQPAYRVAGGLRPRFECFSPSTPALWFSLRFLRRVAPGLFRRDSGRRGSALKAAGSWCLEPPVPKWKPALCAC
jgi:hypothetical protein